jgi:cytosine/adenosine deaminase-related metal-dependent hydrolase
MTNTPPKRLAIEGGLVVGYDGSQHGLLPGATLLIEGDTVKTIHTAGDAVDADERVAAHGCLVMPGLINLEACTYLDFQGLATDQGHRNYFGPSGFNFAPRKPQLDRPVNYVSEEEARVTALYGFLQTLQGGATTVVGANYGDIHPDYSEFLLEAATQLGVRAYISPAFGAATHYVTEDGGGDFFWNEDKGRKGLQRSLDFAHKVKEYQQRYPEADVNTMLFPYRADAMNETLLRETKEAANDAGLRIRMHASQFLMEFYEQIRRTSETPIEFLNRIGFLGENVLLHHAILTAEHGWTPRSDGRDIDLLADTGTSVGHCPTIFARRAVMLESFEKHVRKGVNIGLGTDTVPQDMLMVMRWAASLCKIAERNVNTGKAADVFNAATLAGAKALGRNDIGRLAPGAKADFLIIKVDNLRTGPLEDPLRNLVNCATSSDIESVWVGGRKTVENGKVIGIDEANVMNTINDLFERKRTKLLNDTAHTDFPPSLPVWKSLSS